MLTNCLPVADITTHKACSSSRTVCVAVTEECAMILHIVPVETTLEEFFRHETAVPNLPDACDSD